MKILALTLQTNNLKATEEFYSTTLGLQLVEKTERSLSYAVHFSRLTFELTEAEVCPTYHFAFNIPLNKMQEALTWLSTRVQLILNEDQKQIVDFKDWKAQAIYFYDSNQNILEFIGREGLQNNSAKAFDTEGILCLNEVGIVTEEPLKLAEEILGKTKVNYFDKGPKRSDFVAMGDDNGLFVISTVHRNWYPTSHQAQKYNVGVAIRVGVNNPCDYQLEFNDGKLAVLL